MAFCCTVPLPNLIDSGQSGSSKLGHRPHFLRCLSRSHRLSNPPATQKHGSSSVNGAAGPPALHRDLSPHSQRQATCRAQICEEVAVLDL